MEFLNAYGFYQVIHESRVNIPSKFKTKIKLENIARKEWSCMRLGRDQVVLYFMLITIILMMQYHSFSTA